MKMKTLNLNIDGQILMIYTCYIFLKKCLKESRKTLMDIF